MASSWKEMIDNENDTNNSSDSLIIINATPPKTIDLISMDYEPLILNFSDFEDNDNDFDKDNTINNINNNNNTRSQFSFDQNAQNIEDILLDDTLNTPTHSEKSFSCENIQHLSNLLINESEKTEKSQTEECEEHHEEEQKQQNKQDIDLNEIFFMNNNSSQENYLPYMKQNAQRMSDLSNNLSQKTDDSTFLKENAQHMSDLLNSESQDSENHSTMNKIRNFQHITYESEDEDDGIQITINTRPSANMNLISVDELTRINNLVYNAGNDMYNSNKNNNNTTNNIIDNNVNNDENDIDDLAIKAELDSLVAKSINPKSSKCITVKFQNQVILIPINVPISNRLASLFWPYPKTYVETRLPSQDEFDKNLEECRKSNRLWTNAYPNGIDVSQTIGIFAAKYKKNVISLDMAYNGYCTSETISPQSSPREISSSVSSFSPQSSPLQQSSVSSSSSSSTTSTSPYLFKSSKLNPYAQSFVPSMSVGALGNMGANNGSIWTDEGFKQCLSGVYQYCDFALIIIKNGIIIDYAIHGYRSNIAECINRHKPVKVFYNANEGDALDVFMHYPYQPFYKCMKDCMQALKIYRLPENFNSISFCERSDIYCALCSALKDFRGLMFQVPRQKLIVHPMTVDQSDCNRRQYQLRPRHNIGLNETTVSSNSDISNKDNNINNRSRNKMTRNNSNNNSRNNINNDEKRMTRSKNYHPYYKHTKNSYKTMDNTDEFNRQIGYYTRSSSKNRNYQRQKQQKQQQNHYHHRDEEIHLSYREKNKNNRSRRSYADRSNDHDDSYKQTNTRRNILRNNITKWNLGKNQYGQPTHNSRRLRLRKAEKTPTRYLAYVRKDENEK